MRVKITYVTELPVDEMPEVEREYHSTGFKPDTLTETLTIGSEEVTYQRELTGPALTPKGAFHKYNRGDQKLDDWRKVPTPPEVAAYVQGREAMMNLAVAQIRQVQNEAAQ